MRFAEAQIIQYLRALAFDEKRHIDSFLVWLERLEEWDGEPRLSSMLENLFGASEQPLTRWASRYTCVAAIQRAYNPGCLLSEIPVLVGAQGIGKSALFRNLLPPDFQKRWFTESLDMLAPAREKIEATLGAVVVEIAEMAGVGRELQKQKSYLTAVTDKARLAYRRRSSPIPRRFIFVGSADRMDILPNDPAGNRRFVAIKLNNGANVEKYTAENRTQLWAEALNYYNTFKDDMNGLVANLPRELTQAQAKANEEYRMRDDDLEDRVNTLKEDEAYQFIQILAELDLPSNPSNSLKHQLRRALQANQWRRTTININGKRSRRWKKGKDREIL